jgi:predicted DsbA family dithiol-disulfide isomerase
MDVFSDVACPWCFIGFRNLQRVLGDWEGPAPEVYYRAFQLSPEHPAEGIPFDDLVATKFGGRERFSAMSEAVRAAGAQAGISFAMDRIAVSPNTRLAHAVIAASRRSGSEQAVVEALFSGYFSEGVDITDAGAIVALLESRDAITDPAGLVAQAGSGAWDAHVDADLAIGAEIGVRAVPVFIADGVRGVVGAQPPEVLRRLMLGGFATE